MRKPSAYQLAQQVNALMERVDSTALLAKEYSKPVAKLVDEAAGKLADALDILMKEVERRRELREKYERELRAK